MASRVLATPSLLKNRALRQPTMNLNFAYRGVALASEDLRYNPCDDIIFPSVVKAKDHIENALGKYYMYFAPHDAPGGICLAYTDVLDGPWIEYSDNPIINRSWLPHYEVSHVSSPHVLWNEAAAKFYLYFHGENDTTRVASSHDGIHFEYEGVAVSTSMYDGISEASYARVFPCRVPGKDANFVLLFMGNNNGTRRIYAAWSRDGKSFEAQREPLISPPPGTGVTQVGAPWYFPHEGKHYVIFHGDKTDAALNDVLTDLYIADVGPDFQSEEHLGLFYDRRSAGENNARVSDPCLIEEQNRRYLFMSIGSRLKQEIALAREIT
jgi:hypothetical protein